MLRVSTLFAGLWPHYSFGAALPHRIASAQASIIQPAKTKFNTRARLRRWKNLRQKRPINYFIKMSMKKEKRKKVCGKHQSRAFTEPKYQHNIIFKPKPHPQHIAPIHHHCHCVSASHRVLCSCKALPAHSHSALRSDFSPVFKYHITHIELTSALHHTHCVPRRAYTAQKRTVHP